MWSLYPSRDGIVVASWPLQIYTESSNPIGPVFFWFLLLFLFFFILATSCVSLLISVKVIKMEAIFIIIFGFFIVFFFTYYKDCECTADLYWFFQSRTTNISLHMKS